MFMNNCLGCYQSSSPVYFWTPFPSSIAMETHMDKKVSSFQISDILQLSTSLNGYCGNNNIIYSKMAPKELPLRTGDTVSRDRPAPSALGPLQALCASDVRGFLSKPFGQAGHRHGPIHFSGGTSAQLKFGISRILADDFGKAQEKAEKENNQTRHDPDRSFSTSSVFCGCSSVNCPINSNLSHSRHALSAVHALQPPQYPVPPQGSDSLPGPYSVLSTDTSIGHHAKRKRSWSRAVFSNLQRKGLEKRFEVQKYVTKPDRRQLAAMLGLTDAQVKVWFQNRRMKWRHAQQQKENENKKDPSNTEGVAEKEKEEEVMSESSSSEAEIDATDDEEVADVKTPETYIKMETQNIS
ncbi:hypothetical protein CHS0354_008715 [Potamilus streckersoni]|uniref:Homeobox domain-containing protein n=1 Tax=Potamilus streckersoni TaxID=2493646 RepID=A0AAE0VU41_9BIVA|nr:hypothetical protein CHS0354_008715 [Potamilus streckersoni]